MLYDLFLFLWALVQVPLRIFRGRGGDLSLKKRLGFVSLPKGPVILMHGVSVGEIKVLSSVYSALKTQLPVVVTTSTLSGIEEIGRSLPGARACLLPIDLSFVMRRFMRRLQPKVLILSEGDLWPNHLKYAKRGGAFIACINAKLSERSFPRLRLVARHLVYPLDLVCAQSETYAERFKRLGAAEVVVTGNIKFDRPFVSVPMKLKKRLRLQNRQVITIGSTHPGEEKALLSALAPLISKNPKLHILLAPRHKERADSLWKALQKLGLPMQRLSMWDGKSPFRVMLIDELGLLQDLYRLSDVSIVAGSFSGAVGGHNLFEPLLAKSALIYGPHIYSQRQMHELVRGAKAGLQLEVGEVASAVERLFENQSERKALAARGQTLAKASQGALKKTLGRLSLDLKEHLHIK